MTLGFLIYSWFPYGGQQRDFLKVARECVRRGHIVNVYTMKWEGDPPAELNVTIAPVQARGRIAQYRAFTRWVSEVLRSDPPDLVVGFNKMPGLDVYFAADPCFAEKARVQRGWYYRFTPRYRHFIEYERAVFDAQSRTQILLISPLQRDEFTRHYPECEPRLHDLPPGIDRNRMAPPNAPTVREELRKEFALGERFVVLQVGSGFVVKGVDRSLRAIAALPERVRDATTYILIGQDKPQRFIRLAKKLGISDICIFLQGRDDIPRFLQGADLLLHPAYSESAGYVLLEAVIAGLPVLTTDTCGYAFHIGKSGSGQVSPSPYQQEDLDHRLLEIAISAEKRAQYRRNGLRYARTEDLYSMTETAADLIEQMAAKKRRAR